MKPKRYRLKIALPVASALALAASPAQAVVTLYTDNFASGSSANDLAAAAGGESVNTSGATGAQHTQYGTSSAAAWFSLASETNPFRADGTVVYSAAATVRTVGGAYAAFTPKQGYTYTASATIDRGINPITGEWITFGFKKDLTGSSFTSTGYANVLILGDGSDNDGFTFQGDGTSGAAGNNGTFNFDNDGANVIDIVMNTMPVLSTDWTVQYFVGGNSLGPASLVTSPGDFGEINHIGFSSSSADGTISNFSLTVIPEPSAALLGALGALALLRRRR
jgi:hypothetical protein